MQWVKASERMPPIETNGNAGSLTLRYKFKTSKGEELLVTTDNKHITVKYLSETPNRHDLEWLDESAPRLQEAAEWVRVEDGLPEVGHDKLWMAFEDGSVEEGWYRDNHDEPLFVDRKGWKFVFQPTHWKPFSKPAPPKPNNE